MQAILLAWLEGREQKTSRKRQKLQLQLHLRNCCNDGNESKSGVWRSRLERKEGCWWQRNCKNERNDVILLTTFGMKVVCE